MARVRLYNPDLIVGDEFQKGSVEKTNIYGKRRPTFEIIAQETSAAAAELGVAATAEKDGATTPFQVVVVSSDVGDIDTGAGKVRAVRVIGITVTSVALFKKGETPLYTIEELKMNGTTDVTSTRFYIRVIHVYACRWGSGGADAEGNITLEAPANTALLTIAAGTNESNGAIIYGIAGRYGRWSLMDLAQQDPTITDATDATMIIGAWLGENNILNQDPDADKLYFQIINGGHIRVEPEMFSRKMTNQFRYTWTQTTGETDMVFGIYILYEITR